LFLLNRREFWASNTAKLGEKSTYIFFENLDRKTPLLELELDG